MSHPYAVYFCLVAAIVLAIPAVWLVYLAAWSIMAWTIWLIVKNAPCNADNQHRGS